MNDDERGDRLQKVLARAGVGSRRHVEDLIREGKVTINGKPAQLGDRADLARDAVKVEGKRVHFTPPEHRYLLLHKPMAVMSTASDPEGRPTVLDLIPVALRKGLVPVGRLDFMTTGLILMTTDGDLAHRVAHPRYGCKKTYEVKVKGHPDEVALRRLRTGILLEGRKTAPAEVEGRTLPRGVGSADNSWWTVRLTEGRTRQIREMFQRVGHPVQKLRRVAIGPVHDEHLLPGRFRELTQEELEALRSGADQLASEARRARAIAQRKARSTGGKGSAPRSSGAGAEAGAKAPRKSRAGGVDSAAGRAPRRRTVVEGNRDRGAGGDQPGGRGKPVPGRGTRQGGPARGGQSLPAGEGPPRQPATDRAPRKPGGKAHPGGSRPSSERSGKASGGPPRGDGPRPDVPRRSRGPGGASPGTASSSAGRPGGSRPSGARPVSSRPAGTRPAGTRPASARPADARPSSARPGGSRPAGTRPEDARPAGKRPGGARPNRGKKASERPAGPKPAPFRPGGSRPGGKRGTKPGSPSGAGKPRRGGEGGGRGRQS